MTSRVVWASGGYAVVPVRLIRTLPGCISVFAVLASHANVTTGEAFPAQATMALTLGMNERTLRRKLAQLEEHGWLTTVRHGANTTNTYILHDPASDRANMSAPHPGTERTLGPGADRTLGTPELEPGELKTPPSPPKGGTDQDANGRPTRQKEVKPITKASQVHRTAQDERRADKEKGKRTRKPVVGESAASQDTPRPPRKKAIGTEDILAAIERGDYD